MTETLAAGARRLPTLTAEAPAPALLAAAEPAPALAPQASAGATESPSVRASGFEALLLAESVRPLPTTSLSAPRFQAVPLAENESVVTFLALDREPLRTAAAEASIPERTLFRAKAAVNVSSHRAYDHEEERGEWYWYDPDAEWPKDAPFKKPFEMPPLPEM
jgi:hypothetical protein